MVDIKITQERDELHISIWKIAEELRGAVDSVFKMLMDDEVVKSRLKEYAKINDANMFIDSIFHQNSNKY